MTYSTCINVQTVSVSRPKQKVISPMQSFDFEPSYASPGNGTSARNNCDK